MSRPVRSVGVVAPGRPALLEDAEPEPGPGQCWVRTRHSGVSAGTEVALVRGTDPHHQGPFDRELRLFGGPGPPGAGYPIRSLGYMEVGVVEESRVPGLPEGALVAAAYGHRTARCLDPVRDAAHRLPEGLDPVLGVLVAQMGPIAVNGLLHAAAQEAGPGAELADGVRGRRVLVVGAGVVGLLCALLAQQHGADVAVVASGPRRDVAGALGLPTYAEEPSDPSDPSPEVAVKRAWAHGPRDSGADLVLQCRARDTAVATALRACRPQGTVVDLAFHSGGAGAVRLGEEFHHSGLVLRAAQIGHLPRGTAGRWDRRRMQEATLDLLQDRGDDLLAHVVTDRVPYADAPAFLTDLAAPTGSGGRRRSSLLAVLDLPA